MWICKQKKGGCDETQRESQTAWRTEMQYMYLNKQEYEAQIHEHKESH